MNKHEQISMSDTEQKIVDAAIQCFVRFGATKTSMNDIARAAGVSRQTLYDLFGSKDELIRASIRQISLQSMVAIEDRLAGCHTLADRLDVYLEETTIKSFELLQTAGDPEDLISGHNAAGAAAIEESREMQRKLVSAILVASGLSREDRQTEAIAGFVVSTAMGLKSVKDRSELDALIKTFKEAVVALASKTTH